MSAIKNLIKAHKAQSISKDTHTLKEFVIKFGEEKGERKGIARMNLVGIETKYIPKFDNNSPEWNGTASGNGHRTRFVLEDGSTIGSFSQASHELFKFFASLMGYDGNQNFLHIDIVGVIIVDVQVLQLDASKSTYDFTVIEEGSNLLGFTEYLPNAQEVLGLTTAPTLTAEPTLAIGTTQTESEEK